MTCVLPYCKAQRVEMMNMNKNSFSEYFNLRTLLHYLHFIHLSFIHIHHFDTLSLAVWQDTCHTYKNLVYDLAHHEPPIAQWLERPTGIWKVMGSTPVGGSENFLSEYFHLRTLLHYLHFIQVINQFIIYSHLSFQHFEPYSMA